MRNNTTQAMALTMAEYDYDTLRQMYERLNLRLTPIESNAKRWKENGWTEGDVKRWYSYSGAHVTAKYWADIMRTIKPEQVELLQSMPLRRGETVKSNVKQFVQAFLDFLQGHPFEEQMRRMNWPMILASERELMDIIFRMAHQPENARFLKYVDQQILTLVYYTEHVNRWTNLEDDA